MSFTATITRSVIGLSNNYSNSVAVTGGLRTSLNEPVTAEAADLEMEFQLDVSEVKALAIRAVGGDLTIETNSASVPDNTFVVPAGTSFIFPRYAGDSLIDTGSDAVSTDISSIFVTNADDAEATLFIDAIVDPTPA